MKNIILSLAAVMILAVAGCSASEPAAVETAVPPTVTPDPTNTPEPKPTPSDVPTDTPDPTPMPDIDLAMHIPDGNPLKGRNKAVTYRCYGCHVDPAEYGPQFQADGELPPIIERGEVRIASPDYNGQAATNLEYIIESIFLPEVHLIPGDWEEPMPLTFHLRIKEEELADIIAWMKSIE